MRAPVDGANPPYPRRVRPPPVVVVIHGSHDPPATADRGRSLVFYRDGLGLEPFGPLAADGLPERLQLRLESSVSLMLIPTGGFGWVAGEDRVAPTGANECVLSVYVPDGHAVRVRYDAALAAGGTTVYEPSPQEWGSFAAQVADPDGHLWMVLVRPDDWAG